MTVDDPREVRSAAAEVDQVSMRFGATVALDQVSMQVRRGESRALVGRNGAGKSTLVSILTGLTEPLQGSVRLRGEAAPGLHDREGWRERVACVYQRKTLVPALTVAENLLLNDLPRRRGRIDWPAAYRRAEEIAGIWQIEADVRTEARALTIEQRQLVEIARALRRGSEFLILDEPTAELESSEIERLFDRLRGLQSEGIALLYISHHLHEIFELCDSVTVLRDGREVLTAEVAEVTSRSLVDAMVGDQGISEARAAGGAPAAPIESGDGPLLEVHHLTSRPYFEDVNFSLRPGEIVGLAGLAGSGRVQVAEAVVGLEPRYEGEVAVAGHMVTIKRVDQSRDSGIGYVPQDRHAAGFAPNLSVAENVTLGILGSLGRHGLVNGSQRDALADDLIAKLDIKASSRSQLVSELSGGNQQKCVMARALASDPSVLVLVNPTSGIDIASKELLFGVVEEEAAAGKAVLVVSDELDELRICHRILVMYRGRVGSEVPRDWRDAELVATMEGVDAV